jgi:hypothetical protein
MLRTPGVSYGAQELLVKGGPLLKSLYLLLPSLLGPPLTEALDQIARSANGEMQLLSQPAHLRVVQNIIVAHKKLPVCI